MNFGWLPSLGIYLVGILIIGMTFKKHLNTPSLSNKDKLNQLLQAEQEAQFVRSKPIPDSFLIQVDFTKFPTVDHSECHRVYCNLIHFSTLSMVNLQGQTNLELKKHYGPQTLEQISAYEKNYFDFMNMAIKYGQTLYEHNFIQEARLCLEQCIAYHCDISKCYILLIEIYKSQEDQQSLKSLKSIIEIEMGNSPFLHKVLEML